MMEGKWDEVEVMVWVGRMYRQSEEMRGSLYPSCSLLWCYLRTSHTRSERMLSMFDMNSARKRQSTAHFPTRLRGR